MRVVLLNTHWTISRRLDEWLARTDWDVAVLLEGRAVLVSGWPGSGLTGR